MKYIFVAVMMCAVCCSNALAGTYWTNPLQNWHLNVNNGVIYLTASNMPSHCNYSRAEIDTTSASGTGGNSQQYNKDLWAYLLSASIAGKTSLSIVLDNSESRCHIFGADAN